MEGTLNFLNARQNYPLLVGMQTNLYKCFITKPGRSAARQAWQDISIPKASTMIQRAAFSVRKFIQDLRAHFQFHNDSNLFAEVHHQTMYSVNVYRPPQLDAVNFINIVNLYHPSTVDRCYCPRRRWRCSRHARYDDNWEIRGHAQRIVRVNQTRLRLFADLYDAAWNANTCRLDSLSPQRTSCHVLERFAEQTTQLARLR